MAARNGLRLYLRDPRTHTEFPTVKDGATDYAIGKPGAPFEICVDVDESSRATLPQFCGFCLKVDSWLFPGPRIYKPRKQRMVLFRGIPSDWSSGTQACFTFTDAGVALPGASSSSEHRGVICITIYAMDKWEQVQPKTDAKLALPGAVTSRRDETQKFTEHATLGVAAGALCPGTCKPTKHTYRKRTMLPFETLTLHYERREVLEVRGVLQAEPRVAARVDLCTIEPARPVERPKRNFVDLTDGDDEEQVKRTAIYSRMGQEGLTQAQQTRRTETHVSEKFVKTCLRPGQFFVGSTRREAVVRMVTNGEHHVARRK